MFEMLDHQKGYFLGKSSEAPSQALTGTMPNLGNVHKKSPRLQVMPGNRKGAFNTMLLHLRITCITFTVGQPITFSVILYYIYGGVSCYI